MGLVVDTFSRSLDPSFAFGCSVRCMGGFFFVFLVHEWSLEVDWI